MTTTLHVVQFSGGIGSYMAARRIADEHPGEPLVLLFANTLIEHNDVYRFIFDAAHELGAKAHFDGHPISITRLVAVQDGRTPQEAMWDARLIGNSKVAPCSHLLKQIPARKWLEKNADPDHTILYVGIDWSEEHRKAKIVKNWAPWRVEFPMCEPPYLDKLQMIEAAKARGLKPPIMYEQGYPHANCGGTCVRAGQKQWAKVLEEDPARYAGWEAWEQKMRAEVGDYAMLRDRRGGTVKPLPLLEFRQRIQEPEPAEDAVDPNDWGGCGCMTDAPPDEPYPAGQ